MRTHPIASSWITSLLLPLACVGVVGLTAGCEHKSKRDEPTPKATEVGGGGAKADLPAEPVGRDPNAKAAAPPSAADTVRPPVAADLAEYTKDLAGNGPLVATIETNKGAFHCELFADKTPMTVANFVGLATGKKAWQNPKTGAVEKNHPFYDGLTFHRVIPEFMVQGGDPMGTGTSGPGYNFEDEFAPGLGHKPGTLSMANVGKATNGSQFFITEIATTRLDGKHTIFGQCKEVELVKQITHLPQDAQNRPNEPVTITKVTIARG